MQKIGKLITICVLVAGMLAASFPMQANAFVSSEAAVYSEPVYPTGFEMPVFEEIVLKEHDVLSDFTAALSEEETGLSEEERAFWTNLGSDYYYNSLDEQGKALWDDLENMCLQLITSDEYYETLPTSYCYETGEDGRAKYQDILLNFLYSNPQYFFLSNRYGCVGSYDGNSYCYTARLYIYEGFWEGTARKDAVADFYGKIKSWVGEMKNASLPEEQLKIAFDIVCNNTVYDYEAVIDDSVNPYHQSAYSMVCMGRTVCAGYAKTISILAGAVGIENTILLSRVHSWNLLKLHGYWYELDATWADQDSWIYYKYYNCSRNTITTNDSHNSHAIDTTQILYTVPDTLYDMLDNWKEYNSPYFTEGQNTYFAVNANESLGDLLALALKGTVIPTTVDHNDNTYTVVNGGVDVSAMYGGVDYSPVYNAEYYQENNSDVAAAFNGDTELLIKHFVEYGMAEGRQASAEFQLGTYKSNYGDIAAAFGNDNKSYYMHYISCGKAEGRTAVNNGSAGTGSTGGNAVYNGVDYSTVYDKEFYGNANPDVAGAFNGNAEQMLRHFVEYGMSEGRQASASFDLNVYRANNGDVAAAFGNDNKSYYMHYINCGKAEGRVAYGNNGNQNGGQTGENLDYSLVFDAEFYANTYGDIKAAFGNDADAMLNHFIQCGMSEGRQGRSDFNVQVYKAKYGDLSSAYGEELIEYYKHYIKYGHAEGRTGR